MFGPIVAHVAALTEGGEVLRGVVRGVMIAVPGGQDHARSSHLPEDIVSPDFEADEAPCPITPGAFRPIPPATVPEVEDSLSMLGPDRLLRLDPRRGVHRLGDGTLDLLPDHKHGERSMRTI